MQQEVKKFDIGAVVAGIPTVPDAFLRWKECNAWRYRPYRFELSRGKVSVMQQATSRWHNRICNNIVAELRRLIDLGRYEVNHCNFSVQTLDGYREPDVMVEPLNITENELSSDNPIFLVEVLSPTSVSRDFVEKAPEYGEIPTVQAYLICSQDRPHAWLWARSADGTWPERPEEVIGREKSVAVPGLSITLPMSAIYHNIPDAPEAP